MTLPNNQNSLDEILLNFAKKIENLPQGATYNWEEEKAAINKTIMESLPEKKDPKDEWSEPSFRGYNQAIDDMKAALTKKYGRADNG